MNNIHTLYSFCFGAGSGILALYLYYRLSIGRYEQIGTKILQKAEQEAQSCMQNLSIKKNEHLLELQKELEQLKEKEQKKLEKEEARFSQRHEKVISKEALLEKKESDLEKDRKRLHEKEVQLNDRALLLTNQEKSILSRLEQLSDLSSKEAKEQLFESLKREINQEMNLFVQKRQKEAEEEADQIVKKILAGAINRLAVPCVSETTTQSVSLPDEQMKGRIIGKEGRNIRAIERATGVTVMMDDSPGVIVLSGFDPTRMAIAKLALTDLIKDGRIHPTRIDECVEKAKEQIEKNIRTYGEDAAYRTGQTYLHPEIIKLLGMLKFRYSFGQNVLEHSVEVSHLMGMIADELHLDRNLAKRIGLLHDIGKSISHEVSGTHAIIGHDIALKYGESLDVAIGIGCHHGEMDPNTVEASFCAAADAISASRPGARIEALDQYIKRVQRLEKMAKEFDGIDQAYAMQSGKELCVVVLPEKFDDAGTSQLARELTKRIEKEMHQSGKIKVTVIRETRAVEYTRSG